MLYPPRSSDDDTYRRILAMVSSDDMATRRKGSRLLFWHFAKSLFVFAEGAARSSQTESLRSLWDPDEKRLNVSAFAEVLDVMRKRLRRKAQRGPYPHIRNLSGYIIGIFKKVAYDIWRQQRREDLRYRNGRYNWESMTDYRSEGPLDVVELKELTRILREDIREFVRKLDTVNRIILVIQLMLIESPIRKRGRNKLLVALVNEALILLGYPPMPPASIIRRANRLWHELVRQLLERGWNV